MKVEVVLHQRRVKQVDTFEHQIFTVVESANLEKGIVFRKGMAKAVFAKLKSVLSNLSIGVGTRVRIHIYYVWSKLTYGCQERLRK